MCGCTEHDAGHSAEGAGFLESVVMSGSAPGFCPPPRFVSWRLRAGVMALLALGALTAAAGNDVYRWTDDGGTVHLSSEKPPAGVKYDRLTFASTGALSSRASSTHGRNPGRRVVSASTAEQAARRNEVVAELQNRECVVSLEAVDRLAHAGKAVDPDEFRRLQQTADRNCSRDPARRSEQEQMAAQLRVAKGDVCVDARNRLAAMLEPGQRPTRDQLKTQQEFIETWCKLPVR